MLLPFTTLFLTLLLGGGPDLPGVGGGQRAIPTGPSRSFQNVAEPPSAQVDVGDPAPDFAYQGYDGRWMRLHHLLDHGPMLIVFGVTDGAMAQIEKEREPLLGMGVIPVAVLDRKSSVARALVGRLGLKFTVLADPRQVIASQFNAFDGERVVPSWFVIDQRGKVRGLFRGRLPPGDYLRLCARSLGLPMPGTVVQTSR
jgi:peroxiredoxin